MRNASQGASERASVACVAAAGDANYRGVGKNRDGGAAAAEEEEEKRSQGGREGGRQRCASLTRSVRESVDGQD